MGFKVIQIHAAHGYLISLLLSKSFNYRSDKYGEYTYVLRRIIEGIRKREPELIVDVRISLIEGIAEYSEEIIYKKEIIKLKVSQFPGL